MQSTVTEVSAQDQSVFDHRNVVLVGGNLFVSPLPLPELARCVTLDERGRRCRRFVGDFGFGHWDWWVIQGRGEVEAVPSHGPAEAVLAQRCPDHAHTDGATIGRPDWVPFDPDNHPQLWGPCRQIWTPEGVRVRADRWSPEAHGREPFPDNLVALYRWYDADDALLYIGISKCPRIRANDHRVGSTWADYAVRSRHEMFATRDEAAAAEVAAIASERPIFNVAHNSDAIAKRQLVAYLISKDRLDLLTAKCMRG